MFFFEWRMLHRRWYAVVLGLAATLGLSALAAYMVPVSYQASAQILLLPPKSVVGTDGNPYLNLGGLNSPGDILARLMMDGGTRQTLASDGVTADYTVSLDPAAYGPVLIISVAGPEASSTITSLRALVQQTPRLLTSMQSSQSVTASALITSTVLSEDQAAATARKSQIRALLVAFAGGLTMTWLGTALLDSLLRRRRPAAPETVATPAPEEPAVEPAELDSMSDFDRMVLLSRTGAPPPVEAPSHPGHSDVAR